MIGNKNWHRRQNFMNKEKKIKARRCSHPESYPCFQDRVEKFKYVVSNCICLFLKQDVSNR